MDEDDQREEEASALINACVDNAQTLMEEYGWSKDDVLDSIGRALEGG